MLLLLTLIDEWSIAAIIWAVIGPEKASIKRISKMVMLT